MSSYVFNDNAATGHTNFKPNLSWFLFSNSTQLIKCTLFIIILFFCYIIYYYQRDNTWITRYVVKIEIIKFLYLKQHWSVKQNI